MNPGGNAPGALKNSFPAGISCAGSCTISFAGSRTCRILDTEHAIRFTRLQRPFPRVLLWKGRG
nr:MAG TPA: hypothetical protein [Caudoviricetes sp.]